jgi:hypothetical protein
MHPPPLASLLYYQQMSVCFTFDDDQVKNYHPI